MLDISTIVGKGKRGADALADAKAAKSFWDSLPHRDPVEMQRRICDELAKGTGSTKLDIDRFRAVRALDRRASRLLDGIVSEYATLSTQSPALERQLWQAALELSHAFAQEYERFLGAVRGNTGGSVWQERKPELLIRLFQHREVELLLVLFHYEKWQRARWKSLHDAYRYATENGFATRAVVMGQRTDGSVITVTLEQVYIRILLLQLLDGGQFRPEEVARTRRAIVNWSKSLGLQKLHALLHEDEPQGFIVDLAGTEGLRRIDAKAEGELLWLDTTAIADAINTAMASRGDVTATTVTPQAGHARLLGKLQHLFAPQARKINRRGERTAVALASVEATFGELQTIFRMLRDEARRAIAAATVPTPYADEITITDVGSMRPARDSASARVAGGGCDLSRSTWHVRDRSDSGCRLRGRVMDVRRLLPGLLIAFREDPVAPWTVAVVRRLNRLMGNNVEIGVEHIGCNPQRIVLLSGPGGADTEVTFETQPARFIALFLRENDAYPKMPIRTLLLPACEFAPGRVLTMLSTTREATIRLKEPLDRQADFVWTSFEQFESGAPVDSAPDAAW